MKKVTDMQYWMDGYLIDNLDSMINDLGDRWDFVIVVTGDGDVGVGKSVIAGQVGYYFAHETKRYWDYEGAWNYVFSGEELIRKAKEKKHQVFVYDESREDLDSKKTLSRMSKTLQDFFAVSRIQGHVIIIVLPDYFELTRGLAIARSECLINVIRIYSEAKYKDKTVSKRQRGRFIYYGKDRKKELYNKGKKERNYSVVKGNFWGDFRDFWVVNEEAYTKKKLDYLQNIGNRAEKDEAIVQDFKRKVFIEVMRLENGKKITNELKAELLGISLPYYYEKMREIKEQMKKSIS